MLLDLVVADGSGKEKAQISSVYKVDGLAV